MTAATFLSRKWPDPSFGSRAVVRCFVGADGFEDVLDAPDADIVDAVCRHLAAALPLPGAPGRLGRRPLAARRCRSTRSGTSSASRRSRDRCRPVSSWPGTPTTGVGVADTVRGANDVAERVLAHLAELREGRERGMEDRTERVR